MKKCKYCQAQLAENGTFCPSCGKDNSEPETAPETAASEAAPSEETAVAEGTVPAAEPVTPEGAPAQEAPAEIKAGKKATPGKIALAAAAVVVLVGALIALVVVGLRGNSAEGGTSATEAVQETGAATVPADGNPDDVTCKGTYTVSDEEALANLDTVVAVIGDRQLTNRQLQIYYRSAINSYLNSEYGYYMMMYGAIDYTQPLDTQISWEDESLTWQQYFVKYALENWQLTQAMAVESGKAGMEMAQENRDYLDALESSLTETAETYGITLEELLQEEFGVGVGLEDFAGFQELYYQGLPYYEAEIAKLVPTEKELEAFFAEHEEDYANSGVTKDSKYVDVRHILIAIEGGTTDEEGNITYSDEDWKACEEEAQAILDEWLKGDKTEDSFAALATEKTEDPGSQSTGGLYQQVYEGQLVQPFNDWCFDESRAYGDYGLVKTDYGYHVMFFVNSEPQWKYYAENDWTNEKVNQLLTDIVEDYPMEVEYEKISLSNITLG